jgi:hypothetical protein
MKLIWGFVDYENTGTLEGIDISKYDRLFVFCGPKNNRIKIGTLSSTEFTKIELIGLKTTGTNNLDFHLTFYLGRSHEKASKDTEFHVISNDGGFNGLVNHIKNIGRKCKRVSLKNNNQKSNDSAKSSYKPPSQCASLVVSRLTQIDGRKRPRKVEPLKNWIKSQCNHMKPSIDVEIIFSELSTNKLISLNGSNVSYKL